MSCLSLIFLSHLYLLFLVSVTNFSWMRISGSIWRLENES